MGLSQYLHLWYLKVWEVPYCPQVCGSFLELTGTHLVDFKWLNAAEVLCWFYFISTGINHTVLQLQLDDREKKALLGAEEVILLWGMQLLAILC